MVKKLLSWLRGAERVVVLEMEKPAPELREMNADLRDALSNLANHPAMQYLLAKHAYLHASLKHELESVKHKSLDEVAYLQHGLRWTRWLKDEFTAAGKKLESSPKELLDADRRAFEEIRKYVNEIK